MIKTVANMTQIRPYDMAPREGHETIECDMGEDFFESMSLAWDKALQKIKDLSESSKYELQGN